MINYLDIHTHKSANFTGVISIQSFSLTADDFKIISKIKPISIGLHPWYATLAKLKIQIDNLSVFAKQPNVKLIGECGLDKLKGACLSNQISILKQQITLAEQLQKPLILHCVKAFDELVALKKQLKISVPLIIHGFNKSEELGAQLIANGFLLSFGAVVLNKQTGAAKLIQKIDHFFLETDDSEIGIEEIYQAVAELKNCTIIELKARIFANWKKIGLI